MKGTTSRECFGRLLFSLMLLYIANPCFTSFQLYLRSQVFFLRAVDFFFFGSHVSPVVKRFVGCYAFWLSLALGCSFSKVFLTTHAGVLPRCSQRSFFLNSVPPLVLVQNSPEVSAEGIKWN
jgi:hypothetical protein